MNVDTWFADGFEWGKSFIKGAVWLYMGFITDHEAPCTHFCMSFVLCLQRGLLKFGSSAEVVESGKICA